MKIKFYIIIFVFTLIGTTNCKKKYPEDPKKTTKAPENRLTGAWNIVDYTLNGSSILDTLSSICKFRITLYDFDYLEGDLQISGNFGIYNGYNSFSDNNFIRLDPWDSELFNKVYITPFKYVKGSSAKWSVTKLYENDLHLKMITDTGEYKISLIRKPI